MIPCRLSFVLSVIAVVALVGCSLVGYSIDEKLTVESSARSSRVYVDGNGEGLHVVQDQHRNRSDPGFGSMGMEIDKEIFKALTTRRQENDMSVRDESGCPDGDIKVCSVSEGCTCEERQRRPSQ